MANEGQVRLEAVPVNFEELDRRLVGIERALASLQAQAKKVNLDVDTSGLEKAETEIKDAREELERLENQADDTEEELEGLGGGVGKVGAALALATAAIAAFVIAFGAVVNVTAKVTAAARETALQVAALRAAFTGIEDIEVDEELARLAKRADELGVSLKESQNRFGPFVQTVILSGGTVNEARVLYDAFSVAVAGAAAPAEALGLVLTQVEQALSKNRFELQDIKAIANQVPGFMGVAKNSFGELQEEAEALRKKGLLPARIELGLLAPALVEAFSGRAAAAAEGLVGRTARLENALEKVRRLVAARLTGEFEEWTTLAATGIGTATDAASTFAKILANISKVGRVGFVALQAGIRSVAQEIELLVKAAKSLDFSDVFGNISLGDRFKQNIDELLTAQRQAEQQATVEAEAGARERQVKLDALAAEALRDFESRLRQREDKEAESLKRREATELASLERRRAAATAAAAAAIAELDEGRAGIQVPVSFDFEALDEERAALVAKIEETQQQLSAELAGAGNLETLAALRNELLELARQLQEVGTAGAAAGQGLDAATEPLQRQQAVIEAVKAAVAAIGPAWNKASAEQRAAVLAAATSTNFLAERGRALEADLLALTQTIAQIFPEAGEAIRSGLEAGTGAAAELQAVVADLESSTTAASEAASGTVEPFGEMGDSGVEAGEKLGEAHENVVKFTEGEENLFKETEKAKGGLIKFGDEVIVIGDGAKAASERMKDLVGEVPEVGKTAEEAAPQTESLAEAIEQADKALGKGAESAREFDTNINAASHNVELIGERTAEAAEAIDPDLSSAIDKAQPSLIKYRDLAREIAEQLALALEGAQGLASPALGEGFKRNAAALEAMAKAARDAANASAQAESGVQGALGETAAPPPLL